MSEITRFEKLLEPSQIGKVKTKNRMMKSAASMSWASQDKCCGDERSIFFYEALAKGGVGLIIVETTGVDTPLGVYGTRHFHIEDDKCIAQFSELARAIHKYGCPAFLSIFHAGPYHRSFTGLQPVSASALTASEMPPGPAFNMLPRELTVNEIEDIVGKFASAAERAQKAGFDGIEINASRHHLLNSFLSRFWNRRQDAYGCTTFENRARILTEIIQETKKRLGQDFPVGVLINGAEYGIENGITPEESQAFAQLIEKAGADCIQIRANGFGDYFNGHLPDVFFYPEPPKPLGQFLDGSQNGSGAFVPLSEEVKKAVSIPVITIGRLDPILGENILQQGKADFIAMTRRLIADPNLPQKIASGRLDDITPCAGCLECCRSSRSQTGIGVRCKVNAIIGSAHEYAIEPAKKKKKVIVVGSGPAGMEAARVAALRGHDVMLYDQARKLGGLLPLAIMVKGCEIEKYDALIDYFETQLKKLGVQIRLGTKVDLPLIENLEPDVAVLATGGIPGLQEIPGMDKPNVVRTGDLHRQLKLYLKFFEPGTLRSLTKLWMPIGKRVVVMGGSIHGCELAEFLVKRGRHVTIMSTEKTLGDEMVEIPKYHLFRWLAKKGVVVMTEVKFEEITDEGLTITTKEGKRQTIGADTVVIVAPLTANNELRNTLEGKTTEIYAVGDCREPHLIIEAIADGSRVAQEI